MIQSYWIYLLIPAGGSASTANNLNYPSISLGKGTITGLRPVFPSGTNQLVFIQLLLNGNVIFPSASNQNNYLALNDTPTLYIPFTYPLFGGENVIDLQGYNNDSINPHLITIGIDVEI